MYSQYSAYVFFFFFSLFSTGNWTCDLENAGHVLCHWATSSALFLLIFMMRQHLTKLPRLVSNSLSIPRRLWTCDPPASASQVAGITCAYYHTQLVLCWYFDETCLYMSGAVCLSLSLFLSLIFCPMDSAWLDLPELSPQLRKTAGLCLGTPPLHSGLWHPQEVSWGMAGSPHLITFLQTSLSFLLLVVLSQEEKSRPCYSIMTRSRSHLGF
jgi:hypothetical protein